MPHSSFATTRWTQVLDASGQESDRQAALSALCETYWYPLYAYLRRRGQAAGDAQERLPWPTRTGAGFARSCWPR